MLSCFKMIVVKVAQLYLTLCNPVVYTVHGILLAKILEWVAFPFSRGSSQLRDGTQVSWIAGRFFIGWVTREPEDNSNKCINPQWAWCDWCPPKSRHPRPVWSDPVACVPCLLQWEVLLQSPFVLLTPYSRTLLKIGVAFLLRKSPVLHLLTPFLQPLPLILLEIKGKSPRSWVSIEAQNI